jgi:hypothetical protein
MSRSVNIVSVVEIHFGEYSPSFDDRPAAHAPRASRLASRRAPQP